MIISKRSLYAVFFFALLRIFNGMSNGNVRIVVSGGVQNTRRFRRSLADRTDLELLFDADNGDEGVMAARRKLVHHLQFAEVTPIPRVATLTADCRRLPANFTESPMNILGPSY